MIRNPVYLNIAWMTEKGTVGGMKGRWADFGSFKAKGRVCPIELAALRWANGQIEKRIKEWEGNEASK